VAIPPDESSPRLSSFSSLANLLSLLSFTKKTHDSNKLFNIWHTSAQFKSTPLDLAFQMSSPVANSAINSWASTVSQLDDTDTIAFATALPMSQILQAFAPQPSNQSRAKPKNFALCWDWFV